MKRVYLFYLVTILALFSTSVACTEGGAKNIDRDSAIATANVEERVLETLQFEELKINIVGNIEVRQAANHLIRIVGEKKLVDKVVVVQDGKKVKISMDRNFGINLKTQKNANLTIYITAPNFTEIENKGVGNLKLAGDFELWKIEIESEGVGNIVSENLRAHNAKVESKGVGTVTLKGASHTLKIESEGVGNIDAGEMTALFAFVESEGVGKVICHASREITIKSKGVGDVIYKGKPAVKNVIKQGIGKIIEQ